VSDGTGYRCNLSAVGRKVDLDDLVDARGVADLLGLSHPNSVSVYQHRHSDMPRPALDLGERRVKLWLRSEIAAWAQELEATGRNKPGPRPSK
jgi:predicted DNA-binding transcriptional regulator AlpA